MPHSSGERTYNFINMTGQEGCGLRVLSQAASTNAGARWNVEHVACGHVEVMPGIRIRAVFKSQRATRRCFVCRPKKGTGT